VRVSALAGRRWSGRRRARARRRGVPQQDAARVTLAPKLDRGFAKLDFTLPPERLLRRIRAATPRPGVDLELTRAAKRLRIVRARLGPAHGAGVRPGSLRVESGRLLLAASDGWLELEQIQLAGKRPMRADELLRGFRVPDAEEARTP
jgi:methionyl-tRNA formyltransferase